MGLAFGSALLVIASMTSIGGCSEAKKEAPAAPAASTLAAAAVSAPPSEPALAPSAAPPAEPELEAVLVDGGADAGPRKLRRLGAKTDAGALVETVAAAPPPDPPAADPRKGKKAPGAQMSDDLPYGGGSAAGSGAPVLKKTPLPSDDPWAKAPPPTPAAPR